MMRGFELCSMQDYSNKIISCEFKNFEDSVNYLSGIASITILTM